MTIDDIIIHGTPTNLRLVSGSPDLSKTIISGSALRPQLTHPQTDSLWTTLSEHLNVARKLHLAPCVGLTYSHLCIDL